MDLLFGITGVDDDVVDDGGINLFSFWLMRAGRPPKIGDFPVSSMGIFCL